MASSFRKLLTRKINEALWPFKIDSDIFFHSKIYFRQIQWLIIITYSLFSLETIYGIFVYKPLSYQLSTMSTILGRSKTMQ